MAAEIAVLHVVKAKAVRKRLIVAFGFTKESLLARRGCEFMSRLGDS